MNSYVKQGDCLELMKDIPDKSIDMILCDLPYGTTQNPWDSVIPYDKLWEQYNRIIKDNGAIALFAQGLFYVDLVNSNRDMFRYDLVWNKVLTSGFLNANRMPLRSHEQIAVFYKNLPTYNPQKVLGEANHSKGDLSSIHENNNYGDYSQVESDFSGMKNPVSILTFEKTHPSIALHPTQKNVELLEYLIKTYTNKDDIVLDNCMGSGSTIIACINTKRKYIGFELDENYFNLAKKRIETRLNTPNIFDLID